MLKGSKLAGASRTCGKHKPWWQFFFRGICTPGGQSKVAVRMQNQDAQCSYRGMPLSLGTEAVPGCVYPYKLPLFWECLWVFKAILTSDYWLAVLSSLLTACSRSSKEQEWPVVYKHLILCAYHAEILVMPRKKPSSSPARFFKNNFHLISQVALRLNR